MNSPRWPTARVRELRASGATGVIATRYLIGGGTTAAVYIGLTLLLSGPAGVNIQIAIPIAYTCSLVVHFSLQRWFVWAHHEEYALASHVQVGRYLLLALAQYAFTATATAVLPSALGVSAQLVYVVSAVLAAVLAFLAMRYLVFHAG
jgi:putative flippase GtrA